MACLGKHVRIVDRGYSTPCWEWTGRRKESGYGQVKVKLADGRYTVRNVHRVVAERCFGRDEIAGLDVDHKCRNRPCFRPRHLRPLPVEQNRGASGRR